MNYFLLLSKLCNYIDIDFYRQAVYLLATKYRKKGKGNEGSILIRATKEIALTDYSVP